MTVPADDQATAERDPCPCGYDNCSLTRDPDALRPRATSYTMDYGPDWPSAPEPRPAPPRRGRLLLRHCVIAVAVYAMIWAAGVALLTIRPPMQLRMEHEVTPPATHSTTAVGSLCTVAQPCERSAPAEAHHH